MSEKTEQATPKRLRKAREDGQVAKSAEFTGALVMAAAFGALIATGPMILEELVAFTLDTITLATSPEPTPEQIQGHLFAALETLARCIAPVLAVAFATAALISYVQVGALFTLKPVIPDASKLDMSKGLKNLMNKDKAVMLVKNLVKIGLMTAIGYTLISGLVPNLLRTPRSNLSASTALLREGVFSLSVTMIAAMLALGIADLVWQRHKHKKSLMMSKDEVTREHKESEGDPMLKGKRRQLHQELMNDPGLRAVPDADAVVVNPTHVAVALRYRQGQMHAPKIIAAGRGETARQIKALAKRCRIPIVRNVPLARALADVGVEQEIPEDFYESVSVILNYAYSLRDGSPQGEEKR